MNLMNENGCLIMEQELRREGNQRRYAVCSAVAGVFFALVLGLVTFGQGAFSFAYSQNTLLKNLVLLPTALGGIVLLAWLRGRLGRAPYHGGFWRWLPALYFPLLLCAQLLFVRGVWFYPGWDILNLYQTAGLIAKGMPFDGAYFRLCPNNAPLTLLLTCPLWAAEKLGLAVPYAVLPYLSALMVNLACVFCALCVWKLTASRLARAGALFFCTFMVAFSLTASVPYTDAFSVLFPVLALYVWLSSLRPFPKWFTISLVCFFGASIKPTVLVFEIALILLTLVGALKRGQWYRKRWRHVGLVCLAILLGAVPGKLWQAGATVYLTGSAQPQEQLSETHYLMLGMNGDTFGGHSPQDVAFSSSFKTLAERRQANLQRAWERVSGRTFAQNVFFFSVKAYKAFSDGSLAGNQSYLMLSKPTRTDALSRFLRAVYYPKGEYNALYNTLLQAMWLGMLSLCLLALWGRAGRREATALLGLTLLGLGIYLLLFEVWPRYLYLYAPLFAALAALGLENARLPCVKLALCAAENAPARRAHTRRFSPRVNAR